MTYVKDTMQFPLRLRRPEGRNESEAAAPGQKNVSDTGSRLSGRLKTI